MWNPINGIDKNSVFHPKMGRVFLRWQTGYDASHFDWRAEQLEVGARALFRYTQDSRFLNLPNIQQAAEACLPDMVVQYTRAKRAWDDFMERWFER